MGNEKVFSKDCEETFKAEGTRERCNPCGEMRNKLTQKKKNLRNSKRRKLNRPLIRCGGIYRTDADELTLEAFKYYRKRFGRKGTRIRCNECAKYSKKITLKKKTLKAKRK